MFTSLTQGSKQSGGSDAVSLHRSFHYIVLAPIDTRFSPLLLALHLHLQNAGSRPGNQYSDVARPRVVRLYAVVLHIRWVAQIKSGIS